MHCREEVEFFAIVAKPKVEQRPYRNAIQALIGTPTAAVHSSTRVAASRAVAGDVAKIMYADHLVEKTKMLSVFRLVSVDPVAETIVATVELLEEERKHYDVKLCVYEQTIMAVLSEIVVLPVSTVYNSYQN